MLGTPELADEVLERLRQAVVPQRNERVVEKVIVKYSCNIRQSGLLQNIQHSLFWSLLANHEILF